MDGGVVREPAPLPGLKALVVPAVLAAAGLIVFHGCLDAPFTFDDITSIVENDAIRSLWPLQSVLRAPPEANALAGRPLVSLSLALTYAFAGLDVRGYHAFSLALHVVNALLLLGILRRTLAMRDSRSGWNREGLALAVALLWLVHPLQTEPVTYAIQRTELLMAFFYLGTLYASIRAWRGSSFAWRALALACCALGVAAKEVMVTAPIVVLLYDRAFVSGSFREALRRRGGFYASLAATWLILFGLVATGEQIRVAGPRLRLDFSFQYLLVQGQAVLHYLGLVFWPAGLRIVYDWPVRGGLAHHGPFAIATAALAAATAWTLWRNSWAGFLGAWFFLILAPSSSVLPLPTEVVAERRMYLPLAAVLTLVAVVAREALLGRARPQAATPRWRSAMAGGLALVVLVALGARSIQRVDDYRSPLALWGGAVKRSPGSAVARAQLGRALLDLGRLDEAMAEFRLSVQLAPHRPAAYQYLGLALAREGRLDEAEQLLRRSVQLAPGDVAVLFTLAAFLAERGQPADAAELFRRVLALRPDDWQAHHGLALALERSGAPAEAAAHHARALQLAPDDPGVRGPLALAAGQAGAVPAAKAALESLVARSPRDPQLRNFLGTLLVRSGQPREAIAHFEQALLLRPDYAIARFNLGSALAQSGQTRLAIEAFRQVTLSAAAPADVRRRAGDHLANLEREETGAGLGAPASTPAR